MPGGVDQTGREARLFKVCGEVMEIGVLDRDLAVGVDGVWARNWPDRSSSLADQSAPRPVRDTSACATPRVSQHAPSIEEGGWFLRPAPLSDKHVLNSIKRRLLGPARSPLFLPPAMGNSRHAGEA